MEEKEQNKEITDPGYFTTWRYSCCAYCTSVLIGSADLGCMVFRERFVYHSDTKFDVIIKHWYI